MAHSIRGRLPLWLMAAAALAALLSPPPARAQTMQQIRIGYQIAPVPLNLKGKDWKAVGLGSYLVNTTGCNDCHTHPNYATNHNPFLGQPEQFNTSEYMAGGRQFGPITSANLTPDASGLPAGLTLKQFLSVIRTGHDPADPPNVLLQVMPWPLYRWKTDQDLTAIYAYLSAIPSLPDNPNPGP
jgi:hypothetical protein